MAVQLTTNFTGLGIKQKATNSMSGTVVLNGATGVAVANTDILITDIILFGINTVGGTPAAYSYTITAGTGFTVTGTLGDTSTLNYVIIRNVP